MDIDVILRIIAVVVGLIILSSSFIDFHHIFAKLLMRNNTDVNKNNEFIQIIDLWYRLRDKCHSNELVAAITKLDEVFPLLNNSSKDKV